jgi:acetylornithine deacetylase/succinyl-diaminopimelate desuccinylase-like protein
MQDSLRRRVVEAVRAERVGRFGLDLCRITSHTGETREATARFVAEAEGAGFEIDVFDDYPSTPTVVARLRGTGGGPSLELNAHIDTIPLDHAPAHVDDGILYGRGATDMKGSLAACLEAARALRDAGARLKGDVLVTTHGMHEGPVGHSEDLIARLHRGVHGDAAIVAELGTDDLPVIGLGMGIFEVVVSRAGEVTHETATQSGTPNPLYAGAHLVERLRELDGVLARHSLPYVGAESVFVGEFHAGDFYNRFPIGARLSGTRRWAPDRAFEDVHEEMANLCRQVGREFGLAIELHFEKQRDGFRIAEDSPLVVAVQRAYREVNGRDLPLAGLRTVADVPVFSQVAGVPAVYHGPKGTGHHGDVEAMPIAELARVAREYALVALDFCGVA